MKKSLIILDPRNETKIEAAIKTAEGKATVRRISFADIVTALSDYQKRLNISKRALEGVIVHIDVNAQKFPNAYKFTPESTQFSAVMLKGKWRIYNICRAKCTDVRFYSHFTAENKTAIIEKLTWI